MHFPYLELHVITHCNMRCRACNHASPLLKPQAVSVGSVKEDLRHINRLGIRASFIRILGGEPTLNPHLIEIINTVRQSNIVEAIHIVTNGTRLHRMDQSFWDAIDIAQISLYPGVPIKCEERHRSKLLIIDSPLFKETFSYIRNQNNQKVTTILNKCTTRDNCRGIVNGRFTDSCGRLI